MNKPARRILAFVVARSLPSSCSPSPRNGGPESAERRNRGRRRPTSSAVSAMASATSRRPTTPSSSPRWPESWISCTTTPTTRSSASSASGPPIIPNLVDLYSVGKSFEGRDIWQITITNKATGKDTDKPAMFIEGNRHSGEVTAAECALWFADHILRGYGKDPELTKLVDTKAIYVRVKNNPDGSELYLNDGPVEPEHGPAVRRRPGQPPRRGPAGGPRRRRLHPPDPQEGRARQGHDDPGPRRPFGPADEARGARQGRLHRLLRGDRQRRRRADERGRHRRAGPAPQLPRELAADARLRPDRPRLHPGRGGRVPALRDRDPGRLHFPPRAPQRQRRPDHGHDRAHAAPRPVDEPDERIHVPRGHEDLPVLRRRGEEDHRLSQRRRHLLGLRQPGPRRPRHAGHGRRDGLRDPERAGGPAALRALARLRLSLLRIGLVRRRALERRPGQGLRRGRPRHRPREPPLYRRGARRALLQALDEDRPPGARRGRGRRLQPQVLAPEPARRDPRGVDQERGHVQPPPGQVPAAGEDRLRRRPAGQEGSRYLRDRRRLHQRGLPADGARDGRTGQDRPARRGLRAAAGRGRARGRPGPPGHRVHQAEREERSALEVQGQAGDVPARPKCPSCRRAAASPARR